MSEHDDQAVPTTGRQVAGYVTAALLVLACAYIVAMLNSVPFATVGVIVVLVLFAGFAAWGLWLGAKPEEPEHS